MLALSSDPVVPIPDVGLFPPEAREQARHLEALRQDLGERYEIQGYVNRGAFATVWQVLDRVTGTVLAVKKIDAKERSGRDFFQEMRSLFRLEHRHVVRLVNFREAANGTRYLLLDFCAGGSLRHMIARAFDAKCPCPRSKVRVLGVQIAEGLAAAHQLGIVHRDLKPENILFDHALETPFVGPLSLRIADFGLARALRDPAIMRGIGNLTGSPAYMAPEQFIGEYVPASDIYALGVILYELLHGRWPFDGPPQELARCHIHEPPVIDRRLPRGWQKLLARLLAKKPEERPTAEEVSRILTRRTRVETSQPLTGVGPSRSCERVVVHTLGVRAFDLLATPSSAGDGFRVLSPEGIFSFRGSDGRLTGFVAATGLRSAAYGGDGRLRVLRGHRLEVESGLEGKPIRLPWVADRFLAPQNGQPSLVIRHHQEVSFLDPARPEDTLATVSLRSGGMSGPIVRCSDGTVLAAEAPPKPCLVRIDAVGKTVSRIALPGVCCDLYATADRSTIYASIAMQDSLTPFRIDLASGQATMLATVPALERFTVCVDSDDQALYGRTAHGELYRWTMDLPPELLVSYPTPHETVCAFAVRGFAVAILTECDGVGRFRLLMTR